MAWEGGSLSVSGESSHHVVPVLPFGEVQGLTVWP